MTWSRSGPSGCGDPPLESDLKDGHPGLGRQRRGRLPDTAPAQRVRDRRGYRGELDELALAQLRVGRDDDLPPPDGGRVLHELAAWAYRAAATASMGAAESGAFSTEDTNSAWNASEPAEQDLALVREVAEERPLREPRPLGDLGHRDLLEAALGESSNAACPSRPRASGSHRTMATSYVMTVADISVLA